MAKEQRLEMIENGIGGYDLVTERDAENSVRILTGNRSLKFWTRLRELCNDAIEEIEYNKRNKIYKGN